MEKQIIKECLIRKMYTEQQAEVLSNHLSRIDSKLKACLSSWVNTGEEMDYYTHNISISQLTSVYGLKYPAALLTMDWVLREPELAIAAIKKGVR